MAYNGQQYELPTELLPPEDGRAEQQQSAADSGPAPPPEHGMQQPAQGDHRIDVLTAQQLIAHGMEEKQ